MSTLINWAKERGKWDFFSKSKLLVLIGCLEDSTNEVKLDEYTLPFKGLGSVSFFRKKCILLLGKSKLN